MVMRLPFFWYDPTVDLSQDSRSYLDIVDVMRQGRWPQFVLRTPGYPLLIWLVTSVVDRWLAVIFVQNVLSLLSAICLVYSVYRLRRPLALPATLAMCGFVGSSQVLFYDISLLSDSLYTSLVIFSVAFLILAFALERAALFSIASAAMAMAILVRPAGAYFAVIYAFILAFLLWTRRPRRAVLGFLAPFPALLLALCAYNDATIGQFTLTAFGEANLAGATALYWEPDPRLPPAVNTALRGLPDSYRELGITDADMNTVRTSWDAKRLFEIYANAYNKLVWEGGWGTGSRFGPGVYLHNRIYIREASILAIRKHPVLYAKYVWVNMAEFFGGIGYKFDFYASLRYRAKGPPSSVDQVTGAIRPGDPPADSQPPAVRAGGEDREMSGMESALRGLELGWQRVHGFIFQNILWSWAYFAVMALSLAQLVRHRGRHLGAFLLFVLTLVPLGASLVVCLIEVAMDRYSYPTQFVCYLAVALSPLLFRASVPGAQSNRAVEPAGG
jgi:hypothetical protein